MGHPVYYYLRQLRPLWRAAAAAPVYISEFLEDPAGARPILITGERYGEFLDAAAGSLPTEFQQAGAPMVTFADNWLLLPGRFGACRPPT